MTGTLTERTPATDQRLLTIGGVLLGMGLGGFVDGVVIHQILQWHHMGTATHDHDSFPGTTVRSLEDNTLWDGLFHAGTWILAFVGLLLVWRAIADGRAASWRSLIGLLLVGWGAGDVGGAGTGAGTVLTGASGVE